MLKSLFITSVLSFSPLSNVPRIVNDSFPNFDNNVKTFVSTNSNLSNIFNFTQAMSLNGYYNLFFFISFEVVKDAAGPYDFRPTLYFTNSDSIDVYLQPFQFCFGSDNNSEYTNSADLSFSTLNNVSTASLLYDFSSSVNTYSISVDNDSDTGVNYYPDVCNLIIVAVPAEAGTDVPNAEQIYNNGYNAGFADALKNENINDLLTQNYEAGYQVGFEKGKTEGMNSNPDNNILSNALFSIVDLPLIYLNSLLNFEIFGINLLGLFGFMIAIALLIFIFKRL